MPKTYIITIIPTSHPRSTKISEKRSIGVKAAVHQATKRSKSPIPSDNSIFTDSEEEDRKKKSNNKKSDSDSDDSDIVVMNQTFKTGSPNKKPSKPAPLENKRPGPKSKTVGLPKPPPPPVFSKSSKLPPLPRLASQMPPRGAPGKKPIVAVVEPSNKKKIEKEPEPFSKYHGGKGLPKSKYYMIEDKYLTVTVEDIGKDYREGKVSLIF